jgi:hypothetical protein
MKRALVRIRRQCRIELAEIIRHDGLQIPIQRRRRRALELTDLRQDLR